MNDAFQAIVASAAKQGLTVRAAKRRVGPERSHDGFIVTVTRGDKLLAEVVADDADDLADVQQAISDVSA